jgi:hypothetical protein
MIRKSRENLLDLLIGLENGFIGGDVLREVSCELTQRLHRPGPSRSADASGSDPSAPTGNGVSWSRVAGCRL